MAFFTFPCTGKLFSFLDMHWLVIVDFQYFWSGQRECTFQIITFSWQISRDEAGAAKRRLRIALDARDYGPTYAARQNDISVSGAAWNRDKLLSPEHHPGTLGGARHTIFDEAQQSVAEYALWGELQVNPLRTGPQLASALHRLGFVDIDKNWVYRLLKKWRWSGHDVKYSSPLKCVLVACCC